jgi:small-conductance mechanosensitive channel
MTTDLKVGLLSTIYATWLHNNLAIALVIGMVLAAGLMIWRPKRKLMFMFLGFLLLLLQFEYQKHFGKALEEQTVNSVILQGQHLRAKNVMEDVFQKIIPFLLWLIGWGLVFLGLIF